MRTIRQVRTWLIVVAAVFLVLDIAAVVLLLSPAGRSRATRQDQFAALRTDLFNRKRESLPARDMDNRLQSARMQVDAFYQERLPSYYSQISEALGKEAAANHVRLSSVRYDTARVEGAAAQNPQTGLVKLDLGLDVDGSYVDQMRFLNSLERSKLFFIPVQINFGGQQEGGNSMRVTLRLQTYMRKNAS